MRSRFAANLVLPLALFAAACGGGGSSKESSSSGDAESSGEEASEVDKSLGSLLEGATGQRGEKVDGPGKVRFINLLVRDGKATDVDVYWGRPDEKAKAATIRYGEASDYLTPKMTKGFDSAVYSVTVAGTTEELWSWDRFSPEAKDQRSAVWFAGEDGAFNEADIDEPADLISPFTNKPAFPAPTGGKVRLYWRVLGRGIDLGNDLLAVKTGSTCLTNGTGIADTDGNQLQDEQTFQVAPGAPLQLHTNCFEDGTSVGEAVKAPASGRAILFALVAPDGKPHLTVIPVKG